MSMLRQEVSQEKLLSDYLTKEAKCLLVHATQSCS